MTKPNREQIEAYRKEHLMYRHMDGGDPALEPWAIEENMILNYLCDLALQPVGEAIALLRQVEETGLLHAHDIDLDAKVATFLAQLPQHGESK